MRDAMESLGDDPKKINPLVCQIEIYLFISINRLVKIITGGWYETISSSNSMESNVDQDSSRTVFMDGEEIQTFPLESSLLSQ